jgi:internalin A
MEFPTKCFNPEGEERHYCDWTSNTSALKGRVIEIGELSRKVPYLGDTCKDITHLEIRGEGLNDISEITACSGLNSLKSLFIILETCYCTDNSLTSLNSIEGLENLEELIIQGWSALVDISAIENFKKLTILEFIDCYELREIEAIGNCKKLTALDLSNCQAVVDISSIGSCVELTYLNLSGCNGVEDISPIGYLVQLESLDLELCDGLDLSPLVSCAKLKEVKSDDLEGFRELALNLIRIVNV